MILQALYSAYQRLADDPDVDIAPPGFQYVGFDYAVQLRKDGSFVGFVSLADEEGNLRRFLVPVAVKRSSGVASNLLWDKPDYIFLLPKSDDEKQIQRARQQCESFRDRIREVFGDSPDDPAVRAVLDFVVVSPPAPEIMSDPLWEVIVEKGRNLCFIYGDDAVPVTQRPGVLEVLRSQSVSPDVIGEASQCLVTGQKTIPADLHPSIKNVWGAQSAGANIVSFNLDAFCSYGHKSGDNAPVSPEATFAYTTVLNHLLRKGSRQRMQVGDASTVFWAEQPGNPLEDQFAALLNGEERPKGGADAEGDAVQPVRDLLAAVHNGTLPKDDEQARFYVLGLGPNASRIVVRFWYHGPVNEIRRRIAQHFEDIEMDAGPRRNPYVPLYYLLRATAAQGKADNIAPNLGGAVIRAILEGQLYPRFLLQQALLRSRAEQNVTQERAAIMKACVNRLIRSEIIKGKELTMALDTSNTKIGYLLGRLFAVYERTQSGAMGGDVNASLRDRFYGAASSTPTSVLPWLQRMNSHHLRKLARDRKGEAVNREKEIGEIYEKLPASGIPVYLTPEEQCQFGVGYYHQKQTYFVSKKEKEEIATENQGE